MATDREPDFTDADRIRRDERRRVLAELRDGLRKRGIVAGRNPDGVDQTVETVLLLIDELRSWTRVLGMPYAEARELAVAAIAQRLGDETTDARESEDDWRWQAERVLGFLAAPRVPVDGDELEWRVVGIGNPDRPAASAERAYAVAERLNERAWERGLYPQGEPMFHVERRTLTPWIRAPARLSSTTKGEAK